MNFFELTAYAENAQSNAQAGGAMGAIGAFLPFILIILVMYFLMIRPQKKRQKEDQELRDSLQIGDEIMTYGGILGRIVSVKDDALIIALM